MQRRKFLAGLGALAAGGAAGIGTGAFTSVRAKRTVTVQTAGDSDAFLALRALESPNAQAFVAQNGGRSDTLSITVDETAEGGEGVNEQAVTYFDQLFQIENQGTQPVWVWMNESPPGVDFYVGDREVSIALNGPSMQPRPTIQYLTVGERLTVGMSINTVGRPGDRDSMVEIIAEADEAKVPDNNGLSVENSDKGV